MSRVSLRADLYMTQEDQIFVANVVVIDLTQETMVLSVINQLVDATMKLIGIVRIHKYRRFHEGHHFIPMAMEVHGAFRHD
jgi:hypothetical protein